MKTPLNPVYIKSSCDNLNFLRIIEAVTEIEWPALVAIDPSDDKYLWWLAMI
jgi:hypothetical protein